MPRKLPNIVKCSSSCPHNTTRSIFVGHDYEITWCIKADKEIYNYKGAFPEWCPLEEV